MMTYESLFDWRCFEFMTIEAQLIKPLAQGRFKIASDISVIVISLIYATPLYLADLGWVD